MINPKFKKFIVSNCISSNYTTSQKVLHKVRKDFETIAEHFSQKRKFIWTDIKPFLKLIRSKDRVLDAGCGNGRLCGALKDKNIDYLGIDFSKKLIQIARRSWPKAKFKAADITQDCTWRNLSGFDVCFCIAVLHHIPNQPLRLKILKNIYKALKNNGCLFLTVWNMYQKKYQKYWQDKKQKNLLIPYKISDGQKITKSVNRYVYAFEKKELGELIKNAGFKIKKGKKTDKKNDHNLCFMAKK